VYHVSDRKDPYPSPMLVLQFIALRSHGNWSSPYIFLLLLIFLVFILRARILRRLVIFHLPKIEVEWRAASNWTHSNNWTVTLTENRSSEIVSRITQFVRGRPVAKQRFNI